MSDAWLDRVGGWLRAIRAPRVRFVRRVEIECPHGRGLVSVDMTIDRHGVPDVVLRCSAHESCPPSCDQSCRHCADAVRRHATSLIICPPGRGPDDTAD